MDAVCEALNSSGYLKELWVVVYNLIKEKQNFGSIIGILCKGRNLTIGHVLT